MAKRRIKGLVQGLSSFIALLIFLSPFTPAAMASEPTPVTGTVFNDVNGNGLREEGEAGLSGIQVSNGISITSTNRLGRYQLPQEGRQFIFITIPNAYTPTTSWYYRISDGITNFGLIYTPQKNKSAFTFVHMTDVHLLKDSMECEEIYGHVPFADPQRFFDKTIDEINKIGPDFVVCTGDLIARGDSETIPKAKEWYELFSDLTNALDMPLFLALGNHDLVGLHNRSVDITNPRYGKGMYEEYFGPTYYSFNYGFYHLIVLDPHYVVGRHMAYQLPQQQLSWLEKDLALNVDKPTLVFFHEPIPGWENRREALNIFKANNVQQIFCGHWHNDALLDSEGMPEQVTGAVCGCWWYGPNPDGSSPGYRVVRIDGRDISTFYKATGKEGQINILPPTSMPNGKVVLKAQIYADFDVSSSSYHIDEASSLPMKIMRGKLWDEAIAIWDSSQISEGYHRITVEVKGRKGEISEEIEVKVGKSPTIAELRSHPDAWRGRNVTIEGIVTASFPHLFVVQDENAGIAVFTGDLKAPEISPSSLSLGDVVRVKGQLVDYYGLYELKVHQGEEIQKIGKAKLPHPQPIRIDSIGESMEGLLVEIKGRVVYKSGNGFTIDDGSGHIYVYTKWSGYDPERIDIGDELKVIGIGWQYKDQYEILLQDKSDLRKCS
jgi:predicted MPP superfamily phosphohydrolase